MALSFCTRGIPLRHSGQPLTVREPSLSGPIAVPEQGDYSRVLLLRTAPLVGFMIPAPDLAQSARSFAFASIGFLTSTTILAATMVLMAAL